MMGHDPRTLNRLFYAKEMIEQAEQLVHPNNQDVFDDCLNQAIRSLQEIKDMKAHPITFEVKDVAHS